MQAYVRRLMKCGYSYQAAEELCRDFIKNLSLVDLIFFIESKEHHVENV